MNVITNIIYHIVQHILDQLDLCYEFKVSKPYLWSSGNEWSFAVHHTVILSAAYALVLLITQLAMAEALTLTEGEQYWL